MMMVRKQRQPRRDKKYLMMERKLNQKLAEEKVLRKKERKNFKNQ